MEPHTHPNAAELNYVINGKVHCTYLALMGRLKHPRLVKATSFLCLLDIFTI
ncbi:MAG: hypothetical protein ACJ71K_16465 [Nitrososphaeraceae archaeon]